MDSPKTGKKYIRYLNAGGIIYAYKTWQRTSQDNQRTTEDNHCRTNAQTCFHFDDSQAGLCLALSWTWNGNSSRTRRGPSLFMTNKSTISSLIITNSIRHSLIKSSSTQNNSHCTKFAQSTTVKIHSLHYPPYLQPTPLIPSITAN